MHVLTVGLAPVRPIGETMVEAWVRPARTDLRRLYTEPQVMTVADVYRALWRRRLLIAVLTLALVAVDAFVTVAADEALHGVVARPRRAEEHDRRRPVRLAADRRTARADVRADRRVVDRGGSGQGTARSVGSRVGDQDQRGAGERRRSARAVGDEREPGARGPDRERRARRADHARQAERRRRPT